MSHDDKTGTTSVSFLDTIDCVEPGRVRELLARAGRARTVGATAANERSSRSHLVFLLHVRGTHAATGQTRHGADGAPAVFSWISALVMSPIMALLHLPRGLFT